MWWGIGVGSLLIVGLLWFWLKPDGDRSSSAIAERKEPVVSGEAVQQQAIQSKSKPATITEVIAMRLIADNERPYEGYELLQSLLAVGLRFGKMNIFHRYTTEESEEVLFSLASATEPGIFDLQNMGSFSCRGLTIFMQLAEQENLMQVFERMLDAAQQLVADLGGVIWDDKHRKLDQVSIERWRGKIQCYENSRYNYDLFE